MTDLRERIASLVSPGGAFFWAHVTDQIRKEAYEKADAILAIVQADQQRVTEDRDRLQRRIERLEGALAKSDAVIAGHWWSHRIDGSQWRLEDQAQPVQDAIRRHQERQRAGNDVAAGA